MPVNNKKCDEKDDNTENEVTIDSTENEVTIENTESEVIRETGLLTQIWGPSVWHSNACIIFNYPEEDPTPLEKETYKTYFLHLMKVLPCCTCTTSARKFITDSPVKLMDKHLKNRKSLSEWFYNFHNAVNEKLGMQYNISYEQFYDKYNTYVAKCGMTREDRVVAYKNYYSVDPAYIDYDTAKKFSEYAKRRDYVKFEKVLENIQNVSRESDEWFDRNVYCNKCIKKMKISGQTSLEINGDYEGLPTIIELHLIAHMATTMSKTTINEVLDKINKLYII